MFKKLIQGLFFGVGFGIAFAAVLYFGKPYIFPIDTGISYTQEPEIDRSVTKPPETSIPVTTVSTGAKTADDAGTAQSSEVDAAIPPDGGILMMSPTVTNTNATRPSTYQLWLTHSGLWRIRTVEDKIEVEALNYPEEATVATLKSMMEADLGMSWGQSLITLSKSEIEKIKSEGVLKNARTMNKKLMINGEGVVYMFPDPM